MIHAQALELHILNCQQANCAAWAEELPAGSRIREEESQGGLPFDANITRKWINFDATQHPDPVPENPAVAVALA